jgi:hypothetical protein
LYTHLEGKITLGTYLLNQDSQVRFIVLDADTEQSFSNLARVAKEIQQEGLPSYLETSRRGGHLWFFFSQAVPGDQARDFGRGLINKHKLDEVELFPKQEKLDDGPGSLVRMPFGIHRRSGHRYGFITPDNEPIAPTLHEQIQVLSSPQTVPEDLFNAYRLKIPTEIKQAILEPSRRLNGTLSEQIKASISVLEFVSQYVELNPTSNGAIGLCPFHDDHHPSFGVSKDGDYWHCFAGCGGGSIIDFWMKWNKCDFTKAVKELAEILL